MSYDPSTSFERRRWFHQKLFELTTSLFITPVPDPEHVVNRLHRTPLKNLHIGSLMEGPGSGNAKTVRIDFANGFTEGEQPVEQVQMEAQYLRRTCICPMMRVVKQSLEAVLPLQREHLVGDRRVCPLVDDHNIDVL